MSGSGSVKPLHHILCFHRDTICIQTDQGLQQIDKFRYYGEKQNTEYKTTSSVLFSL